MALRRVYSVQRELLEKSREAALNAVQTFNNPLTTFKTETFIVLMTIAWTYMLHAHFRRKGIEYRYHQQGKKRRSFDRAKSGGFRYWDLQRCMNEPKCPLDGPTKTNLRFLIGLRDEIVHHKPSGLDERLGGRYLACCLNYETWITKLFGQAHSLGQSVALALQFRDLTGNPEPDEALEPLPANVARFIDEFEANVEEDEFQAPQFSYRMLFTRKLANRRGQADRTIEFVAGDSELAKAIDKQYWVLKEVERPKFRPKGVVQMMNSEGFPRFSMQRHVDLWKSLDARNPGKGFGVEVSGQWYWYEHWVERVRQECKDHPDLYGPILNAGLIS